MLNNRSSKDKQENFLLLSLSLLQYKVTAWSGNSGSSMEKEKEPMTTTTTTTTAATTTAATTATSTTTTSKQPLI